jgi:hypothetical protein
MNVIVYEVRDPDGLIHLETLSEEESHQFARRYYQEYQVACTIDEVTRAITDHRVN